MNFLISGGTGFIGSALCSHLSATGHSVVVKTRRPELINKTMKGISNLSQLSSNNKFDVVINLTGEPIANNRWSENQKRKILQSRIDSTKELIGFMESSKNKPALFISSSAIGYYGVGTSNDGVDETSLGDNSFSSRLCAQWEALALQAETLEIRTCILRTGIVLGKNGGALEKMLPPFKWGLGGKIGSGKQWMSWIHLEDLIGIISYCIDQKSLKGPVNCTAPNPVTNEFFTTALGKTIKRPTIFNVPAIIIKLLMGEMGEELLLAGKRVLPSKLEQAGFHFKFKRIEAALSDIL
jgi:uncharacterized protein (TIGR01777 family)